MDIKLTLENKQLYPAVINLRQFSNNTDIIKFGMPDYMYDTTDLSTMNCYAVCDMGGKIDEVKLETEVVEGKLKITWKVTGYTTQQDGHINYLIAFKDIENEESVLWFSYQGIIFVNSSIDADGYIAAKYPSILQQWEERMNAVDSSNKESFDKLVTDTSQTVSDLVDGVNEMVENGVFDGKTILYGEGVPSQSLGKENDTYINTSTDGLYPCFIFTKDDYSKGELDWKPRWTTRGITADTLPLQGIIFIPEEQKIHPGYEEAKDFHIPSEWKGLKAVQKTSEIHTLDGVVVDSLISDSVKDAPSVAAVNKAINSIASKPKPNYVRNSDFTNPISQRIYDRSYYSNPSDSEYEPGIYDLWYRTKNASVSYNDYMHRSYIYARNYTEEGLTFASISQPIKSDYAKELSGKEVTLSLFVQRINKKEDDTPYEWKMCLYERDLNSENKDKVFNDESKTIGETLIVQEGLNTLTLMLDDSYTGAYPPKGIGIALFSKELNDNNSIIPQWFKLNEGKYSEYEQPNYLNELAFCRQYYYKMVNHGFFIGMGHYTPSTLVLPFRLPSPLSDSFRSGMRPKFNSEGLHIYKFGANPPTYKIIDVSLSMDNSNTDDINIHIVFSSSSKPSADNDVLPVGLSGYLEIDGSDLYIG